MHFYTFDEAVANRNIQLLPFFAVAHLNFMSVTIIVTNIKASDTENKISHSHKLTSYFPPIYHFSFRIWP